MMNMTLAIPGAAAQARVAGSIIKNRLAYAFCMLALGVTVASSVAYAQTSPSPVTDVPAPALAPAPVLGGTLFNTREQRERLNSRRQPNSLTIENAETFAQRSPSVINGFVKRSDGRDTVWLDDRMKRDPRAEVVERLEPNVVGGAAIGGIRLVASAPLINTKSVNRISAKTKVSHTRKTRPLKKPKVK